MERNAFYFKYAITVDDEIDRVNTEIQIYVTIMENAVKHELFQI